MNRLFCALLGIGITLTCLGQTERNRPYLYGEIDTNLPSGTGVVTASQLRTTLKDLVASAYVPLTDGTINTGGGGGLHGDMRMSIYDTNANGVVDTAETVNSISWANITSRPAFAQVATTGNYSDLTGLPTIPAAQVNADWNSSSGLSQILNKPTLAAVATSGSAADVGLGNVNNTSDVNKPVSTAQATAIATVSTALTAKADLAAVIRNDASQSLTSTQTAQARQNINAIDITLSTGSTSTAAANTAALQAALNSRGRVFVRGTGIAYINATLVINSGNELALDPQLTIQLVPSTNTKMLVNAAFIASASSVTIAWSAGRVATMTWTSHGLSVGDSVWVKGATQQEYLGVFRVISVTDANTVTIDLRLTPTVTATGTITAVKADKDITIRGGQWNYDYANNTGSGLNNHAILLCGVDRLTFDSSVTNAYKYCVCFGAIRDAKISAVVPTTHSDGIKVYGPAFDTEVLKVDASTGDDLISFQPSEAAAFTANACSFGPIVGVRGGNIFCRSQSVGGQGACVFYTNTTYLLKDVALSGVHGVSAKGGVVLTTNGDLTSGQNGIFSNISVDNVTITAPDPWVVRGQVSNTKIVGDKLSFGVNEAIWNGDTTTNTYGSLARISDYLQVTTLQGDVKTTLSTYGTGGSIYALWLNAFYKNARINLYLTGNSGLRGVLVNSTSASHYADRTEITGYTNTDHTFTVLAGTVYTNIPEIVLNGLRTDGLTGINSVVSYNLTATNCEFYNMSNGIFRGGGTGTTNFRASGNRLLGTSVWLAFPSGTPVLNPLSFDISGDVTLVARNTGNIMNNTNTAAGTLASAGLVVCQGTATNSWKLLSNSSLTY